MAKNYVRKGDTVTITAPAAVVSGAIVPAGSIIGVAKGDASTASGNAKLGVAIESVAASTGTVKVWLSGAF